MCIFQIVIFLTECTKEMFWGFMNKQTKNATKKIQTQDKYENRLGQITPADLTGWNTVGCFTSFHVCIIYHWNRKKHLCIQLLL